MVTGRRVDPGDHVSAGGLLLSVETAVRNIEFRVPQTEAALVQIGDGLRVAVQDGICTAQVMRIHPALSDARLQTIEATLRPEDAAGLRSGETYPVHWMVRSIDDAVLIPDSALIQGPDGSWYVFVVENSRIHSRDVRVLGQAHDVAAIEGVGPDLEVLRHTYLGWSRLSENLPIVTKP